MTRRRIVEPGITWALSRRTTRRHFLLNPDEARQMESKRTGISFVGPRRVLRQAPTKRARSYEAFGSLNPQFAVAGCASVMAPDAALYGSSKR